MAFKLAAFAAHPMSRRDTEITAERILRRLYPGNLQVPTWLDVLAMMDRLEDEFGVVFGVQDISTGEEGYTDPIAREIVVDTRVYQAAGRGDGRARMTCTHEVGHIEHIAQVRRIIRDGAPQLARQINVVVPAYRDPEWQAASIGSALLMPRTTFPTVYAKGGISEVIRVYGVSPYAADVRLNVLRDLGVM